MTLPGEAIVHDPQGATMVFVYFPDQRRVYSRRVEVGTVYGTEVEIKSGLSGDGVAGAGGTGQAAGRQSAVTPARRRRGKPMNPSQSFSALPHGYRHPDGAWRSVLESMLSDDAADGRSEHHHPPGIGAGGLPRRHFRAGGEAGHPKAGRAHLQVPGGAQAEDVFHQPARAGVHQRGAGGQRQGRPGFLGQAAP